ncbi:unnamed protein product [Didymodactylos carnosus]|uniref:G-protein coupled receptors family 1 profile domain-containing protein n=1 Tax=Didymodactylos carnosus TaxID=1234261 RepID=A0A814CDD8_9BILA|nr:unnamed protein product [Didymodactylos carnosus]CAF3715400.1 unnamed protein product [Didymodactylos carnosus]
MKGHTWTSNITRIQFKQEENQNQTGTLCISTSSALLNYIAIAPPLFMGFLPPFTLGLFGYLTYRNFGRKQIKIEPLSNNSSSKGVVSITTIAITTLRSIDKQLISMLLIQIIVYILCTVPFCAYTIYYVVVVQNYTQATVMQIAITDLFNTIASLLFYVNYTFSFYIYMISSKPYRKQFKNLFTIKKH